LLTFAPRTFGVVAATNVNEKRNSASPAHDPMQSSE
jgi:hypothetical protein